MISRCCKPEYREYREYREYHRYDGRGITMCKRWMKMDNFIEDLYDSMCEHIIKHGFSNTTLERNNTAKGYSPDNCEWATWKKQIQNKVVRQIDSQAIVLMSFDGKEVKYFHKIMDAAKFLPGNTESNRTMLNKCYTIKYSHIKGYRVFMEVTIPKLLISPNID